MIISQEELEFTCVHASGPGGQGVNTSASAVQLRFDVRNSPSLTDEVKDRLLQLAGNRATTEGEIVILAAEFRSQLRNREAARLRLQELLDQAEKPPKPRKPTKTPRMQKLLRLKDKRIRSERKSTRRAPATDD